MKAEVEEQLGKNFFYEWSEYSDLTKFGGGDASHDSKIDIDEFWKWVGDRQKELAKEEKIQALFEKLDKDGSGEITKGEMVKAMIDQKLGPGEFAAWVKDRQTFLYLSQKMQK